MMPSSNEPTEAEVDAWEDYLVDLGINEADAYAAAVAYKKAKGED